MTNENGNDKENIYIRKIEGNEISESDEFITFKIIIVGNSGVGKSCFLKRGAQKKFADSYQATIGFEFLLMYYDVNGIKIKLQIWDTCGQEMYRSLIQGFYRNTALSVLIYAVNEQKSFDDLDNWIKDIRTSIDSGQKQPIFLLGNKCDLDEDSKVVPEKDAKEFAKNNELDFFSEVSAKSGFMVEETFKKIAEYLFKENYLKGKAILKKLKMGTGGIGLNLHNQKTPKKKKCGSR